MREDSIHDHEFMLRKGDEVSMEVAAQLLTFPWIKKDIFCKVWFLLSGNESRTDKQSLLYIQIKKDNIWKQVFISQHCAKNSQFTLRNDKKLVTYSIEIRKLIVYHIFHTQWSIKNLLTEFQFVNAWIDRYIQQTGSHQ